MIDYIHVDLTLSPHEAEKCTNIIARQNEDNCIALLFKIPHELADKLMYLDFEKPDGEKFKTPPLTIDENFAEYEIGNNLTDIPGTLKMDVLFGGEDYLWKSFTRTFVIKSAINATQEIVDGNPDWVSSVDSRINAINDVIGDMEQLETDERDTLVNAINDAYNHGGGGGNSTVHVTDDLTLLADGWINNQQTIAVSINTKKRNVVDVYAESVREWAECGVIAISESSNGVTFECDRVPQNDLTFRISSFNVSKKDEPSGGLTPEQIEAINQMETYINNNGELMLDYNDSVLDINFEINGRNLYVDNNIEQLDFNINSNNELEAIYNGN